MECRASVKLFGQIITVLPKDKKDAFYDDGNQNKVGTEKEEPTEHEEGGGDEKKDANVEKPLKKPDKILPCPRCDSMDTKFCYYNNYNVNQPRHFCRNCQRYWTAGGTMRNVPVGAGRRKSKSSGEKTRQITLSAPSQDAILQSLSFLNNGGKIEFLPDEGRRIPGNQVAEVQLQDPSQVHWMYQWTPASSGYQFGFPPISPYWGTTSLIPSPTSVGSSVAGPSSSPLGKHPRDNNPADIRTERRLWAPKGMKIDDPDEVAKSSMWATVGVKKDKAGGISHGGLFSAFHPKNPKTVAENPDAAAVLAANPAALARSLNFNECI